MTKHLLPIALTLAFAQPTIAQIIPDNTTPTTLTPEQTLDRITGQPLSPNATNLFHSFREFSIEAGRTAQFELPNDTITTILTRITGTAPSQIDGTLIVDGTADLFFLNPNGISFGRDSRVNIGGDLILTTADRIQFGDNLSFSATDTTTDSALLSVLVPTGLQFGNNPGAIVNRSQTFGADDAQIRETTFGAPLGISVQPDRALLVIGGDIQIDAGSFSAIDGALELVSLGGVSQVMLGRNQNRYTSASVIAETLGAIALSNAAIVDTSGHKNGTFMPDDPGGQGGNLYVTSDVLSLRSGAGIDVATYSGLGADSVIRVNRIEIVEEAGIYVNAENVGTSGNLSIESRLLSLESGGELNTAVTNNGIGGRLNIQAETIEIAGISGDRQSSINTNSLLTEADAIAGDIRIQANTIELIDGGEIGSTNRGAGQGGSIAIDADAITVRGAAITPSGSTQVSWISVASEGGGTGSIQLRANTLELDDRAQISAAVSDIGDSQGITLELGELSITNGAQIIANTDDTGQGGDVTINAEAITIAGTTPDGSFPSGILAQTRGGAPGFFSPNPAGDSGNLSLTTDRLTLQAGGAISADTFGTGNAGRLSLTANEMVIEGQAAIATASSSNAIGTDISVSPVRDSDRLPSRITAFTAGLGNGGDALIFGDRLTVRDGGRIEVGATELTTTANAEAVGNSGNLTLQFDRLQLDNGVIRADTISGDAGNIIINTADLWLDRRSRITTNATGNATGGNLRINTETLVALRNSDLTATAENNFGGQINLNATGIFGAAERTFDRAIANDSERIAELTSNNTTSDITASSALGPEFSGIVTIETPDIRADEGVTEPVTLAESPLRQSACDTQPGDTPSSFRFTGRGGLPPNLEQLTLENLDVIFAEAQDFSRSPTGAIQLAASLPPQPATCSW
jgi:filamentous hemagglutinin family protein